LGSNSTHSAANVKCTQGSPSEQGLKCLAHSGEHWAIIAGSILPDIERRSLHDMNIAPAKEIAWEAKTSLS
jgi:hypothetical protein